MATIAQMAAMAEAKARALEQAKNGKQEAPRVSSLIGGDVSAPPIAKPKSGRGMRKEERVNSIESRKPWLALGITRRAWYYRQAKDRAPGL